MVGKHKKILVSRSRCLAHEIILITRAVVDDACAPIPALPIPGDATPDQELCALERRLEYLLCLDGCNYDADCCQTCEDTYRKGHAKCVETDPPDESAGS